MMMYSNWTFGGDHCSICRCSRTPKNLCLWGLPLWVFSIFKIKTELSKNNLLQISIINPSHIKIKHFYLNKPIFVTKKLASNIVSQFFKPLYCPA